MPVIPCVCACVCVFIIQYFHSISVQSLLFRSHRHRRRLVSFRSLLCFFFLAPSLSIASALPPLLDFARIKRKCFMCDCCVSRFLQARRPTNTTTTTNKTNKKTEKKKNWPNRGKRKSQDRHRSVFRIMWLHIVVVVVQHNGIKRQRRQRRPGTVFASVSRNVRALFWFGFINEK